MSKKVAITSLLTIMLLVGLVKLFPETIKETYAVSTTLADTVMTSATTEACNASGTGVCATNSYTADDSSTAYHDYRYRGADPNNYVKFNNDLYRIIGVFDDNSHGVTGEYLVKLIMADKLYAGSWGIYSTVDNIASGTYSDYKNDWTGNVTGVKANANILLNEYFYKKSNTSDTYGACSNWTYYYNGTNYKTFSCSDIVGHGIDNSLQNYIQETTWYLKGYIDNEYSKQNFYLCERGQSTDTTNCMSGNSGSYDASTTGKIGLMYASDYLYASSYFADTSTLSGLSSYYGNKNWLYKGYEWTITPDADSSTYVFIVSNNGFVSTIGSRYGYGARPSFYLKSNVYVTGGTGSIDDPYTIGYDGDSGGGSSGGSEESNLTSDQVLTKLNLTLASGTPNFANTSCSSGCGEATVGVYSAEDDLGTSYYFRGDVTNNYVKFAGLYWRIIRINGDGSIRMIYDGTSAHANGESSTDRQIGTSAFNSSRHDNTYVGYMIGTAGASTYALAHSNSTDSTIKGVIDNWYKTNIVDTGYSGSVVDAIYCNDRSIDPTSSGTGIGTSATDYGADYRLYDNKIPTLKCSQVSDRFTTEATVSGVTGNDKLTYPVGLITADEVSMAGGVYNSTNSSYYLYTGNYFWTMSPVDFYDGYAHVVIGDEGAFYNYRVDDSDGGVRPVITLSSSAITGGTGISTDPFTVS